MLSKKRNLAKTPQPAKGKGGGDATKAPKSAPQMRKKKPSEEPQEEDEDIKAMLQSLKSKGKKEEKGLFAKGGSEDDEEMTAEDVEDDDDEDSDESEDVDDENDDDDDDDDDDSEDGSEDEEAAAGSDLEEEIRNAIEEKLQKNKKGASVKKGDKAKNNSKKSASKAEDSCISAIIQEELIADSKRREERDRRTLFVKHIAAVVTEETLKSLSPDIEEVRLTRKRRVKQHQGYAFLGFKDEKTAEKNFHSLQGQVLENKKIFVDYVGTKSIHREEHKKMKQLKPEDIDATKLYVTGFDVDMTSEKLLKLFPKAYNVTLPIHGKDKKPTGYGFVHFATEEEAKDAHDNIQDKVTAGHRLTVLFAKKHRDGQKRGPETKDSKDQPAKKKAKLEEGAEADMEDNDEENEEDDDDDDDDDEDESDDDDDDDDDESE